MTHLIVQALERKFAKKKLPVLRPGYRVKVHQKIKEGEKERLQVFEGTVIAMNSGHGSSKTFTVRKVVEGIGVEKIFPLASPNVAKIDVVKTFGVRRAKLYYLRDEKGLSTRLKAKLGLIEKDVRHGDKNEERTTHQHGGKVHAATATENVKEEAKTVEVAGNADVAKPAEAKSAKVEAAKTVEAKAAKPAKE